MSGPEPIPWHDMAILAGLKSFTMMAALQSLEKKSALPEGSEFPCSLQAIKDELFNNPAPAANSNGLAKYAGITLDEAISALFRLQSIGYVQHIGEGWAITLRGFSARLPDGVRGVQ